MDDISRELGISKKTLYEYVPNKKGLVLSILKGHLDNEKEQIMDICKQSENAISEFLSINNHIGGHIKTVNPAIIYQLKKYYPSSWDYFDQYRTGFIYDVVKENIRKGVHQGLYRDDINESLISKFYISNIQVVTDEKLFPPQEFSILAIHHERVMYHLHGLCNSKGLTLLENLILVENEA